MRSSIAVASALLATTALAQNGTNTTMNGYCAEGFYPGTDTVIYISPYTYSQVMSIIGSFRNLTWSGSPYDSVTINGTDNTVGTARNYSIDGAQIVETITTYSKPPNGPYEEIHVFNSAEMPAVIAAANLSVYAPYDGTTVVETCGGLASIFNFTAKFCANNVTVGAEVLHMAHLGDAELANNFLGNMNFTSCAALMAANSTMSNSSMSMSSMMSTMTSEGLAGATGASASMQNSMAIASVSSSMASASMASASMASASSKSAATAVEPFATSWSGVAGLWILLLSASTAVVALT